MSNYDSLNTQLLYSNSYTESFTAYSDYIHSQDLKSMSYVFIPNSPFSHHKKAAPRFSVTENFSRPFLEDYEEQQFQHNDYILNRIKSGQANSLYLWEKDRKSGRLNRREENVLDNINYNYQMAHGCSILTEKSIHGVGAISIVGDERDHSFAHYIEEHKQELYEASNIFHNHIITKSYEVSAFIKPAIFSTLSKTEKQVLKVLLEGFPVPVIAQKVFRSKKYTEKLVSDIRLKIGGKLPNGKPRMSKDSLIHFCGLMRIYEEL